MNGSQDGGSGCWRIGCLGCGALALLGVMAIAGLLAVAKMQVAGEDVAEESHTVELPGPPLAEASPGAEPLSLEAAGPVAHIRLDLSHAEFDVAAAEAGAPLQVEARFDKKSYELEKIRQKGEDVEIRFRRKGSGLLAGFREMLGGSRPVVWIFLPRDHPLELDLRIRQGGAQADLGGLWLTSANISFEQGGLDLSFGEPLRRPMQALTIDGSMGGFATKYVGNASPARLDASCSMGGMALDLRGPWANDADIRVDARMGGAAVRLPEDVRVEGLSNAKVKVTGQDELELPTLRFSTSASMGEVEILP